MPTHEMVDLGKYVLGRQPVTERYAKAERTIANRVNAVLRQIAPGARVHEMAQLFERGVIGEEGEIYGASYGERIGDEMAHVIAWSLAAPDHLAVARHEAIHYLRRAGLFTDDEWGALSDVAKREGWMAAHQIDQRYPDLSNGQKIEEAVAEEFANWRRRGGLIDRLPAWLQPVFRKLSLALQRIGTAARQILGRDVTPDDIFAKVEAGDVGGRAATDEPTGMAAARPEEPLLPTREATSAELAARKRQQDKAVAEVGMRGKIHPRQPQQTAESAPLFGGKGTQGTLFARPETGPKLNSEQRRQLKAALEITAAKRMTVPDDGRPVVLRNDFGISRDRLLTMDEGQVTNRLRDIGFDQEAADKMAQLAAAGDKDAVEHIMGLLNPKMSFSKKGDILHLDDKVAAALRMEQAREATDGGTSQPPGPPIGGGPPPEGPNTPIHRAAYWAWRSVPSLPEIAREIQMATGPMAVHTATEESRHVAKEFANELRLVRQEWVTADDYLVKHFTPLERQQMYDAADEESVLRQRGEPTAGAGLSRLTPEQRAAVEANQAEANEAFDMAKAAGMVEGEGLPSYTPRMVVMMSGGKMERVPRKGPMAERAQSGGNVRTTSPHLIHRKYLERAETEEAAQKKFGEGAAVVRDIRTLPLATANLRRAIAGRVLINRIRAIGQRTGQDLVVDGEEPVGTGFKWFTLDHPAFKTWRPKFTRKDENGQIVANVDENGKIRPLLDENGDIVFERVPIWVRGDFEGPLKAVMSGHDGPIYRALMALKSKTMSVIMYSPLIHNAVEWGRALPAMPGKVVTFKVYFEGNAAKRGLPYRGVLSHVAFASPLGRRLGLPQLPMPTNLSPDMREMIQAGMVPIGHRYGMQDITSMMEEPSLAPGRSWTAKLLSFVPGLLKEQWGEDTKRAIDRLGDLWHNTLLWDRVADLQMGLAIGMRDHFMRLGMNRKAAVTLAAHFANRYAGALPLEAMSAGARKLANFVFFSRSFTFGNLGAMKDAMVGLPKDVQAELIAHGTRAGQAYAKTLARRKAAMVIATDIALFHVVNAVLQSAIAILAATIGGPDDQDTLDKFGHAVAFEMKGYARRLNQLIGEVRENPLNLFDPLYDLRMPARLLPQAENEPGKQDRILVGFASDGTAIYMNNPTGKIGAEMEGWLSDPLNMVLRKLGTIARPLYQAITNDQGFGRQVWDPNATSAFDHIKNIGRTVALFMGDQVPMTSVRAAWDFLHGTGIRSLEVGQMAGPLLGAMFSRGAPGGPQVGVMYQAKQRHEFAVQQAMPDVRRQIQQGDFAGAMNTMTGLGMSPGYQKWIIKTTQNPGARLSKYQMDEFMRYASPDERALMQNVPTAK